MQSFTLFSLLVAATVVLLNAPQPATGQCCGSLQQFVSHWVGNVAVIGVNVGLRENLCNDCTRPTPYCGYGPCNLFGCACKGGCRRGKCERRRRSTDVVRVPIKAYANASTIVASGDVNGDGALSMKEAQVILKRALGHFDTRALHDLDVNGDGKLTAREIDPPRV